MRKIKTIFVLLGMLLFSGLFTSLFAAPPAKAPVHCQPAPRGFVILSPEKECIDPLLSPPCSRRGARWNKCAIPGYWPALETAWPTKQIHPYIDELAY